VVIRQPHLISTIVPNAIHIFLIAILSTFSQALGIRSRQFMSKMQVSTARAPSYHMPKYIILFPGVWQYLEAVKEGCRQELNFDIP
jgi:hypothetical protein